MNETLRTMLKLVGFVGAAYIGVLASGGSQLSATAAALTALVAFCDKTLASQPQLVASSFVPLLSPGVPKATLATQPHPNPVADVAGEVAQTAQAVGAMADVIGGVIR